jgi:endonuclease YncB( thermonuclease family)
VPLTFLCLAAIAIDGDTLRCANIADANGRVRIARIDAPEAGEPGGPEATRRLAELIDGYQVRCTQVDAFPWTSRFETHDRYGRIVARCTAAGVDLGQAMLASGHAAKWP